MPKKILYITDDTSNLKAVEKTIVSEGLEFDVALSAQEGAARMSSGKPDAVIVRNGNLSHDSGMKQLKAAGASNVPVVVFSGEPEDVMKAVRKGLVPHRVLIAEDDRQMAEILKSVLSHSGYDVRTVFDGAEALKEIRSWQPHVLVLDIMLPVIDGFHVCQTVSEDPAFKNKPKILIISGRGSEWDQNLGNACGAEGYFVKPFTNADFLNKVNEIFADIDVI